jgi:CubicO group peptidase (beta-lactamase class C family)
MIIGTHACAPVLAALTIDVLRLCKGWKQLFPKKHLIAIGLAGALPDLLNPHLALSARYSSWTHTLWFILAIYPLFGIICRTWFRPRWIFLSHCMWLAIVAHVVTDSISGGTRPLYPFGPVIVYSVIPRWIWVRSDLLLISATILLAIWIKHRVRQDPSLLNDKNNQVFNLLPVLAILLVALLGMGSTVDWVMLRLRDKSRVDPAAKLQTMNPAHRIDGVEDLRELIEPIRAKSMIPCMAAIVLKDGKVMGEGISGVRKAGGLQTATMGDLFALGSGTKAITATLMAVLVEEGKLNWTTKVGEVFDKKVEGMDSSWKTVTLEQLLRNRAGAPMIMTNRTGIPTNLNSLKLIWPLIREKGNPIEQRMGLVQSVITQTPEKTRYSNFDVLDTGYTIAGAMAEIMARQTWEKLIQEKVFLPMGIASGGFGIPAKAGNEDPLQGHQQDGTPGAWLLATIPPALGPAGTVHMTMRDWAKFVMAHLRGDTKNPKRECMLIKAESSDKLHTPIKEKLHTPFGEYAMGWGVEMREWAKGPGESADGLVLRQIGVNTIWDCGAWLAPERDFAVLIATNQSGNEVYRGTYELLKLLTARFLN